VDNLTHTLIGITVVRAGLGRRTPGATAAMVLASNAPDLDIVAAIAGGAVPYLAAHRGPTHGLLGITLLAITAAFLVWLAHRVGPWRRPVERRGSFAGLAAIALCGTILHVLTDLPTSYGTRILSPFNDTWFALDWMPIVDIYLWAILIGGMIACQLRPQFRTAIARTIIGSTLLLYSTRASLHHEALRIAAATRADGRMMPCLSAPVLTRHPFLVVARHTGPGTCLQAAALPTFLSPMRWQLVRQQPEGYELRQVSLWAPTASRDRLWVPNESDAWVAAARRTTTGRVFLNFSRLPATLSAAMPDGTHQVRLLDVRFVGGPFQFRPEPQMRPPFVATVILGPNGRVLGERLGM
jgi:membrane-bound metal-dependent hydrolase YbcI (DUF457 family)